MLSRAPLPGGMVKSYPKAIDCSDTSPVLWSTRSLMVVFLLCVMEERAQECGLFCSTPIFFFFGRGDHIEMVICRNLNRCSNFRTTLDITSSISRDDWHGKIRFGGVPFLKIYWHLSCSLQLRPLEHSLACSVLSCANAKSLAWHTCRDGHKFFCRLYINST